MRYIILSKEQISEYLKKVHEKVDDELVTYMSNHGTLNDIDYYVEVMKRYYPNDTPDLIIQLGGDCNEQESIQQETGRNRKGS